MGRENGAFDRGGIANKRQADVSRLEARCFVRSENMSADGIPHRRAASGSAHELLRRRARAIIDKGFTHHRIGVTKAYLEDVQAMQDIASHFLPLEDGELTLQAAQNGTSSACFR